MGITGGTFFLGELLCSCNCTCSFGSDGFDIVGEVTGVDANTGVEDLLLELLVFFGVSTISLKPGGKVGFLAGGGAGLFEATGLVNVTGALSESGLICGINDVEVSELLEAGGGGGGSLALFEAAEVTDAKLFSFVIGCNGVELREEEEPNVEDGVSGRG